MKLIIDISEEYYSACKSWDKENVAMVEQSIIAHGTPYDEERPHGTCKTCKHYTPYRDQFSYGYRGDGYCKSTITNAEGQAYINCHDEWYCANYEKEGEKK